MITVNLRGKVVPKAAPRFAVRGKIAMAYVGEKERQYQEDLRFAAHQAMQGKPPLAKPVRLSLIVYLLPSKYLSKVKRERALAGLDFPDTRPDLSNYIKMVEDAFKMIVFVDDNQVVDLHAIKCFGEIPGMRADIEEMG